MRSGRRTRREPLIAWLGAGAVTAGVGIALVGCATAASADASQSATAGPSASAGKTARSTTARSASVASSTGHSPRRTTATPASAAATARSGPAPTSTGRQPGNLLARQIRYTLFNRPPVATSTQTATSPTGAVTGVANVLQSNGFQSAYTVSTPAQHGTATVSDTGAYSYTPSTELASTGGADTQP